MRRALAASTSPSRTSAAATFSTVLLPERECVRGREREREREREKAREREGQRGTERDREYSRHFLYRTPVRERVCER
jgi:hypothetical protein